MASLADTQPNVNCGRWIFSSAGLTDAGKHRRCNEDALLDLPGSGLWAVADGMGGHTRGDVASQAVVESLATHTKCRSLPDALASARSRVLQANHKLWYESQRASEVQLMGSTVVVLLVQDNDAMCLWAGDSRIYRLRNEQLQLLTRDHSIVQRLMDEGSLEASEARSHPSASRITRAVGVASRLELETRRIEVAPEDRFLLCSDGLPLELSEDEIQFGLSQPNAAEATRQLMQLALDRGARDNVTLCVVDVQPNLGLNPRGADQTAINYQHPLSSHGPLANNAA